MTLSNKIITNDNINLKPKKSISKNFINLDFPDIKVAQCEYSEGPWAPKGAQAAHSKKSKAFLRVRTSWINFYFM